MNLEQHLKKFFKEKGVRAKEGRRSWITDCFACGKEAHCYVYRETGQAKCFKCGRGWDWKGLVATIARCSIHDAHEVLFGEGAGDSIDKPLDFDVLSLDATPEVIKKDKMVVMGPDFVPASTSEPALQYLRSRGITDQNIADYDIHYHAAMHAVVFPIKRNDTVYGWQARRIPPVKQGDLRLISSIGFNKSRFLLNWDRAKTKDSIILVEGPFDCMHVDLAGFGSVATFGKDISSEQLSMIVNSNASAIYIGLDDDAYEEVYRLVSNIGIRKQIYRITPEGYEDFGEAPPEVVMKAIQSATKMSSQSDRLEYCIKE